LRSTTKSHDKKHTAQGHHRRGAQEGLRRAHRGEEAREIHGRARDDLPQGRRGLQLLRRLRQGTYSIATFALAKAAGGKTRLTFTHVGVPSSHAKDINLGWRTFYWKPLKAYLEK
jgi:hypothetical protein